VTLAINGGQMTITSDMYMVAIEAGPDQGQVLPQFNPLGLTNLALVGSVVMENCYTIFGYTASYDENGQVVLSPNGMWAFNKPGGPKIITQPSPGLALPASRAPIRY
jgi:hypothetical protein